MKILFSLSICIHTKHDWLELFHKQFIVAKLPELSLKKWNLLPLAIAINSLYDDKSTPSDTFWPLEALTDILSVILIHAFNLPFSVVDQMAGAATRAPERSQHGLHKI